LPFEAFIPVPGQFFSRSFTVRGERVCEKVARRRGVAFGGNLEFLNVIVLININNSGRNVQVEQTIVSKGCVRIIYNSEFVRGRTGRFSSNGAASVARQDIFNLVCIVGAESE
jgi:hypothetical protein